ncbi:hypothetical protein PO124_20550 [Bacillus licheniformis]|nr:hypothetical protein [Bacillus licheniformis]
MGRVIYGNGNHDINEWTINLMDICPHERILEIGTGSGAALYRIAEMLEGGKACGIDASKAWSSRECGESVM